MSGDVQPRKRKDKKRKKDELGVEEPRGTAAVFGEGDVFMHSQNEHGTGGHWCAKIIFFSLLAILVGLIGLIILENRGLSELEANSVESRYSGVLEGWLEDAPDDDHHDEHTLELNHDDDDDGHEDHAIYDDHIDEHDPNDIEEYGHDDHDDDEQLEQDEEDEEDDEESARSIEDDEENDDNEENNEDDEENDDAELENDDDDELENDDDDELENDDSQEQDLENDQDEDEEPNQDTYEEDDDDDKRGYQEEDGNENDDELQEIDENEDDASQNDDNNSKEIDRNDSNEDAEENDNEDDEEDEEHEEEDEHDEEIEVEKLETEAEEGLEPVSTELPALPEEDDDDDEKKDEDESDEKEPEDDEDSDIEDDGEEFLELDDADEPPVEKITVPAGKPFVEVEEDDVSTEQPPDTLEEEEEYEKRQEELRKEEAQSSHMWLKLGVGGALLVATHAVIRRATHRETPEKEEPPSREETPIDRRLTLIPEESLTPVRKVEPITRPVIQSQILEKAVPVVKSIPVQKQESEEEENQPSEDEEEDVVAKPDDRELYSEEEGDEEVEEEEEEEIVPVKVVPKAAPVVKKPEPKPEPEPEPEDDEDPDDVEIIGDEQLEEELEEEGDEEEISDVDDAELLTRLEAKYGRLPEPERPGQKKDGGNSIEDFWPGEPADAYWRQQLDSAERELRQGSWSAAASLARGAGLRESARARYVLARALDHSAEAERDNRLLSQAIAAYLDLLKMNERLSDRKLLKVAARTLDRIQFRGNYLNAEPVYRLLIRRFPNEPGYRNNLTISFLMANRVDLAEEALKETLQRWPNDRLALAHYGFVLKTKHNKYEEAARAFKRALEGDTGPANEARFYYHYGDALLLLGRSEEAHEVHKRGAKLKHFLSPSQRSLYNVDRLESSPWWEIDKTPYSRLAKALEGSWREILKEGEAAKASYEKEKEGLKERGEWSQLDLFVRGRELPERCARAPVTCAVVKAEAAAAGCRRGQVKFSLMAAGTHVRAHVGPTNCRLRLHLGLSNTKDTYIRVDKEIRQWQVGKVLMFDDSFEHEVWHNGTGARLVLIVDVWHPQLTAQERRQLPAI